MTLDSLHPAVTAIPVGIAFGVILERAGLGDPRVIRGQLVGSDFTVVLVMLGAIVTAMLGLLWFDALGFTDLRALATPPTDIGAQVVGGIVFGGGFAIAALCPGTACVAAASGRRDGMAAVIGVLIGTILTPVLWPLVGRAAAAAPDEQRLLPADLGLPTWSVAVALVLFALAAARIARLVSHDPSRAPWWKLSAAEAVALTLAVAFAGVEGRHSVAAPRLASLAQSIEREEDHVDALELAEWIKEGRAGLRVLDLRDDVDTGTYMIPGAQLASLGALPSLDVAPDDFLVLYSDGGAHAAQGWVLLRMRGLRNVRVLKDGMAAWEDEILAPVLPPGDDPVTRERVARVRALSLWFGGQPRAGNGTFERATREGEGARPRRRRTC